MRRKQNNQGFSLLEVVLSMAILAIISIPLLSYFTQSVKYNAKMADKQHATNLGQYVEDTLSQNDLSKQVLEEVFLICRPGGDVRTILQFLNQFLLVAREFFGDIHAHVYQQITRAILPSVLVYRR